MSEVFVLMVWVMVICYACDITGIWIIDERIYTKNEGGRGEETDG